MDILKLMLLTVIVLGSSTIIFCTALGLYLIAYRPSSLYVVLLLDSKNFTSFVFARVFWICAAIGVFVSFGFGVHALLFWIPNDVGSYSEGEWTPLRDSIAALFGFLGGLAFLQFISNVLPNYVYGEMNSSLDRMRNDFLNACLESQPKRRGALIALQAKIRTELSKIEKQITLMSGKSKTYARIFNGTYGNTLSLYYAFPAIRHRQDLNELLQSLDVMLDEE